MQSTSSPILRSPNFRSLWGMRVFGTMAAQAQAVIVGWQVYSLTHDPLMLGLTGLFEAVPAILCALFAGHIVDISRPHRVALICLGAFLLNLLMLFIIAGGIVDPPKGNVLIWIYAGIFVSGILRSFMMPTSFALFSQIVPKNKVSSGSAWMSTGFQAAFISGPAIAGLIYGGYGVTVAWVLPLALMFLAFLCVISLDKKFWHYRSDSKREPAIKSIKAGWKFIFTNKSLLMIMMLDMFAVLFGGAVAMLPAYAAQVLHVGSEGLGLLRAAPAMGAILMSLLLALYPMKKIRGVTLLWVVLGFGVSMIGFGLSEVFWLSMIFLALSGIFDSVSVVIRSTLMQLLTPDHMRGRVSAVGSMFIISSNEIGAFESGVAARLLGLVPSVVFGGVGTLIVVAVIGLATPHLRKLVVEADKQG